MFQMDEYQAVTYRLDGRALALAKELHEYSKEVKKEYKGIARQITEFSAALMQDFDEKHDGRFREIYQGLADELSIPLDLMRTFNLDASYLDDHNIAFMKAGPILAQYPGGDQEIDPSQLGLFNEEDTLP